MPLPRDDEDSSRRTSGAAPDGLPTYQELLDEALDLTFPASDPISPGAAQRAERPIATPKDDTDWSLRRDHGAARGAAAGSGPPGADDEQPSNYPSGS
jgi:hypothetical protein